jgi:hypothetical protein
VCCSVPSALHLQLHDGFVMQNCHLCELNIAYCSHIGDAKGTLPQQWGALTNLKHLDLSSTGWYPMDPAGGNGAWPANWTALSNLQYLDLSYPQWTGNPDGYPDGFNNCKYPLLWCLVGIPYKVTA